MLNSALFGGITARAALQESLFDPEQEQVGTDWCIGNCKSWKKTKIGRERMDVLRTSFGKWEKENPKEFAKLKIPSIKK